MADKDPVVIVGMARTPMGGLLGDLAGFSANELGAMAIKAAVAEARLKPGEANEVIMGNCLPPDRARHLPARPASKPAKTRALRPRPSTRCAARACRRP